MTAKDLKNALLQESVQGKLVPQIASEGNARDLLEEIRKSHTDLQIPTESAGNKKGDLRSKSQIRVTKKEKNLPEITDDEVPFDIPENWCWCRQSDIANISTGMTPLKSESKFYENGNIPWITSSLTNNEYIENAESFITEYAVENTSLTLYPKNTLILAMYGQGKTRGQISELLIPATINQACAAIELVLDNEYLRKYIKLFHNWNYNNVRKEASGSAQPNLNLGKVQSTLIPLPPLAEQKRIVAAIEKFMPLIEEYGKKETVLNELNAQIGTLTKKAILQEAVQGKLVPQIPAEGNAKDLLEQIKAQKAALIKEGKIKKEKPLPEITEAEIPFDIPENWCWCRLGEIVNKLTDGTHRTPKYVEKGIPFLSVKNLSSGKMDFENTKFITPEEHKELYARCNPEKGDMLLTKVGTTGIPVINDSDIEFSLFVSVALLKFSHEYIDEKYFLYLLQSPLVQEQAQENTKGVGNKNWVMDAIAKTVLVLPPLSEQKRIVAAIEQLLPLCEKLGR